MNEFDDIGRRLRDARPELTTLELDAVKQRVRTRARKGQPMRSRLAILLMLVLGMMLSTTGAGIAIQSVQDDAAEEQYRSPDTDDDGDVLGNEDESPAPIADDDDSDRPAPEPAAQPTQQVEAGSDGGELPFTGFAAIPVLLAGVALMAGGLLLRRRSNDPS